ncbi:hypothetical protein H1Q63_06055 [Desmonostoc muscorum CCALA 125]|uniref:Uncharacterized protein n=1 Tax=Desmonostoc muscorum LEGE 12446 TaxID=1828758 RepID=A0A8J7DG44_DESMC|nr:hypothetical protein [Desmonostoc muscorum]MBX9253526.1 hypothetical protein [Desmonostoc muscorum CCALA 125]MCF2149367.1 hypothetical protein [Desmonostoc muscorum LEGE 12446]
MSHPQGIEHEPKQSKIGNLKSKIANQQPPQVFHNSNAIARYDLYVYTLTPPESKAGMVTFLETKKITLIFLEIWVWRIGC